MVNLNGLLPPSVHLEVRNVTQSVTNGSRTALPVWFISHHNYTILQLALVINEQGNLIGRRILV